MTVRREARTVLLAFRVTNHKSIRDEVELSLVRSARIAARSGQGSGAHEQPSAVAAVYGSNASGKSNLVDALRFMGRAVRDSYGKWPTDGPIPSSPFALDEQRDHASTFDADLLLDGVRYQYGFRLDRDRVHEEWLYAYPHRRRQTWFERAAGADSEFHFGDHLKGQNKVIAGLTSPTTLFLSAAAESNHTQLEDLARWFRSRLVVARPPGELRRLRRVLHEIEKDEHLRARVAAMLAAVDLGITGIEVRPREASPSLEEARGSREGWLKKVGEARYVVTVGGQPLDESVVELAHRSSRGTPVTLPFSDESRGTQALVALAGPALSALDQGGTLVVDELDTSMHPRLVAGVVRLFQSPDTNPRNAQLVFTSHDTSLMGTLSGEQPLLERDQVWFTEKDRDGVTRLYPLTDFGPRKLENLERGYRQGRYGAIPSFDRRELEGALAKGR